ncbi:helix-turn-helix transcriptional regulator [Streptomyces longwoodensis]|uniref:helix-turn-helix transcriptional regulator n=1 Tax=Streptomyces longwoodensis TaxID=68231 RepID=UPI0033E21B41
MTGQTTVRHTAPPDVRRDRPTAVPERTGAPVAEGEARLVTGEPGCGRSRFLDRAARAFTAGPVVYVRADPDSATVPHAGLRALLRLSAEPRAHRPAVPPPDGLDGLDGLDGPSADAALRSALRAACADGPLLVCVDDAHLWDPASRAALGRLGRDPRAAGAVSLLLTAPGHRPVDPEFAGIPPLRLDPLTAAASAALLDEESGGSVDRGVRDDLVAEAEGNPALLLALLRSLTPAQLRGRAPLPRPPADAEILTGLVGGCLSALTDEEDQVLLTAAAAVREAEDDSAAVAPVRRALARLTGGAPGARLDPPPELLVLSDGRLRFRSALVRRALYARAGERERRAAHRALAAQEAGLPGLLHRAWAVPADATTAADGAAAALATGLAAAAADPAVPASPRLRCAALARAADLTGDGRDRARHRLAAAQQALLAGQPHRALRLLDAVRTGAPGAELRGRAELLRGAALLRDGPVDEARATLLLAKSLLAAHAPAAALAATLGAADAAWAAGDVPGCLEALAEGRGEQGRDGLSGTPAGPGADTPAGTGADAPAGPGAGAAGPAASLPSGDDVLREHRRGMLALLERRFEAAVRSLRRVVDGAAPGDRVETLLRAAAAALLMGDLVGARGAATAALVAARTQGEAAALGPALEYLAYTELRAGRHGLARTHAEEGLRAAHRAGQRNTAAHHHAAQALAASIDGDADAVARHVRHAQEISLRHGLAQAATLAEWALARVDLGEGRPAEAADRLGPLVRPGPGRGHFAVWMLAVPCFVEAAARAGRGGSAGPVVEEFAEWARFGADPQAPAQLLRCRALLAPPDRADGLYESALALHETAGGDFERARTEFLYGQWLRRRRRLREARDRLGAALVGFERCGARAWAAQARAELRANGTSAGGARAGDLSALTPQQLRIVHHVAGGATNREIAQALTVSTRTVDYHLRKVFAALGVRSRVELARLVEQTEKTPAHP